MNKLRRFGDTIFAHRSLVLKGFSEKHAEKALILLEDILVFCDAEGVVIYMDATAPRVVLTNVVDFSIAAEIIKMLEDLGDGPIEEFDVEIDGTDVILY